jgi:hypothetical protein
MMCLFTAWKKNFEYPWQPPKIRTKFDTPIVLVYKVITNFTFYNIINNGIIRVERRRGWRGVRYKLSGTLKACLFGLSVAGRKSCCEEKAAV